MKSWNEMTLEEQQAERARNLQQRENERLAAWNGNRPLCKCNAENGKIAHKIDCFYRYVK